MTIADVEWLTDEGRFFCNTQDFVADYDEERYMAEDADSFEADGWAVDRSNLCLGRWATDAVKV